MACVYEAGIGAFFGVVVGWALGSRLGALADFARNGPTEVLGLPLMFTTVFGALTGWLLVAIAERVMSATGRWVWIPTSVGIVTTGIAAIIVGTMVGRPVDSSVVLIFVCVFLSGGIAAIGVRMYVSS